MGDTPGLYKAVETGWAARSAGEEVLRALSSSPDGLTAAEAGRRLASCGANVLASRVVTAFDVLVRQLRNPLLILLLGAAAISGATGAITDAVIITTIVALSIGLGFINEYRSETAVAKLHNDICHSASVWRDGTHQTIDIRGLVPGDVVDLRLGDIVPADVRILSATELECDEAVLTGESVPSPKSATIAAAAATTAEPAAKPATTERAAKPVAKPATTEPAAERARSEPAPDLRAIGFMGTVVRQGFGQAVVVATGSSTAFGKIAVGLTEQQPDTAFQTGLRAFSKLLVKVAGSLTISIFIINLVLHRPLIDALLFSLAIAIGITPQLLPAIVSVSLSSGARRLARRKVLVKRLVTIEDLGNIEILFTDKTGTLTEGAITFASALDPTGAQDPEVFRLGLICNEATGVGSGSIAGNTLDVALWQSPGGVTALAAVGLPGTRRLALLPFDHVRQMSSVLVETDGYVRLITKGAPESVLTRCTDVSVGSHAVLTRLFDDGARVVAVAERTATASDRIVAEDEHDLNLVGFLTFVDRPKRDAAEAIAKLHHLGIKVKIITGDNGAVAAKVCRDLGMHVEGILTGSDVTALDDDALVAAIDHTTVFARVDPEQKSRIVKMARRSGADVAFLGDGVNDAVALHSADVGISVDSATDVAKDAADIVLLDKDLGVLAEGVVEGRRIFANTLKYVLMATSSNFGNMFSAAGASLFLTFLPMLPSQILLNNLLYDVGQLAIPSDRVDAEILARPAAWDISFVRKFMMTFGPISSIFDFATFFVMLRVLHANHAEFRSGWFVESLATQTLVVFLIRTRRVPFFASRPSTALLLTPVACASIGAALPFSPLADVLGFTTLPLSFFMILIGMIFTYLILIETAKKRFYATRRPARTARTHEQRRDVRIQRRAHRFVDHQGPRKPRRQPS